MRSRCGRRQSFGRQDAAAHSEIWRALLLVGLLLPGASASAPGCTKQFKGVNCWQDSDCPAGQGCDEDNNVCLPSCVTSDECPTHAYRCDRGLCVGVEHPECTTASDCTTPGTCQSADSVSCVEGACVYADVTCESPPAPECVDGDSTLRTYDSLGTCSLETGACEYGSSDYACPGCTANCLGSDVCDGVACEDQNGGCQTQGVCVPTSPPQCQYQDAPTNTPCDRPGSTTGALDGFCNQGVCGDAVPVPCADNATCSPETCIGGYCHPAVGLREACDVGDDADCTAGLACEGGVCLRTDGQTCGDNAECLHTCIAATCAGASVASGPCDAAGGGDDDDCQPGLHCNNGTCETSLACSQNSECTGGDTCIGGYCRTHAATGGDCDPGDDADCQAGNACTSGICLLANGQTCSGNDQCVQICAAATCAAPSSTHGPCDVADGTADCQAGHLCSGGECLLQTGQSGCAADGDCVETCVAGTCTGMVPAGGACDSPGDCLSGLQCSGGTCLLVNGQVCAANSDCLNVCVAGVCQDPSDAGGDCDIGDGEDDCLSGLTCSGGTCLLVNGQTCAANSDCLNVCIAGVCQDPSDTGGDCDTGDGDDDCLSGLACSGGTCLLVNGQTCAANSECLNVCVSSACQDPSGAGGYCDTADGDDDCQSGLVCSGGSCLLGDGETCANNDDCANTCINGACAPQSGSGGSCDDVDDCHASLVCVAGTCQDNGIVQVRIQGSMVSGGGSLYDWHLVDANGGDVVSVSSDYPSSSGLWGTIDWTADLTESIPADSYLAVTGSSSSASLTRTFTFYDGYGQIISTLTVNADGTDQIERDDGFAHCDWFTRFHYDGSAVAHEQQAPHIASIRVQGTSVSGGGNPLSGYYAVDGSGNNQGQLSAGASSPLFLTTDWTATITHPIEVGMSFVLAGDESSLSITRTFTFMDAAGAAWDTEVVSNLPSEDIVRRDDWPHLDTYTMFKFESDCTVTGTQTDN